MRLMARSTIEPPRATRRLETGPASTSARKLFWNKRKEENRVGHKPSSVSARACALADNDHSSRVLDCSGPQAAYPRAWAGHPQRSPIWPCSGWGLPSPDVTTGTSELLPHRFTLTLRGGTLSPRGGLFSVALSSRHRDSALRSTLPCGARTFLSPVSSRRGVRGSDHLTYSILEMPGNAPLSILLEDHGQRPRWPAYRPPG
jgi:hypothetical protein